MSKFRFRKWNRENEEKYNWNWKNFLKQFWYIDYNAVLMSWKSKIWKILKIWLNWRIKKTSFRATLRELKNRVCCPQCMKIYLTKCSLEPKMSDFYKFSNFDTWQLSSPLTCKDAKYLIWKIYPFYRVCILFNSPIYVLD